MPHISLPDLPGIRAAMAFRPETSKPLNELVEVLLRGPSTLTPGERELIATHVSAQNNAITARPFTAPSRPRTLTGTKSWYAPSSEIFFTRTFPKN